MSVDPSRKPAAATPRNDPSLPELLARLRDLRERTPGHPTVEDVECQLKRIETGKLSKAQAGQLRQNLRD